MVVLIVQNMGNLVWFLRWVLDCFRVKCFSDSLELRFWLMGP